MGTKKYPWWEEGTQRDTQRENGMEANGWKEKQKGAGLGLDMFVSRVYFGPERLGTGVELGDISNSEPFLLTQHHSLSPKKVQANPYPLFSGAGVLSLRSMDP